MYQARNKNIVINYDFVEEMKKKCTAQDQELFGTNRREKKIALANLYMYQCIYTHIMLICFNRDSINFSII